MDLTFPQLLERGPRPPAVLLFQPEIHRAVRYDLPMRGHVNFHPPVFLHRQDNPRYAYAVTQRDAFQMNPDRGSIHYAVMYPARTDGPGYFEPPPEVIRHVVVKQLRKDFIEERLNAGHRDNPYQEIALCQSFGDNIHVIRPIEALEDYDYIYIVTPMGTPLTNELAPLGVRVPLSSHRVRFIFARLLAVVQYLAECGICHGDLKPANFVFLAPDRLVAIDLGLAVKVPRDPERLRFLIAPNLGIWFGTPAYMPSEVHRGDFYDGLFADLWAACAVLFEMLTGHQLCEVPNAMDLKFLYFVLAMGLANPLNPNAQAVRQMAVNLGVHEALDQVGEAIDHIHPAVRVFLGNLLCFDPAQRPPLAQVLQDGVWNVEHWILEPPP